MPNIELIERLEAHYRANPPRDSAGNFDWRSEVCVYGTLEAWGHGLNPSDYTKSVAQALGIDENLAWSIIFMPCSDEHVFHYLARAKAQ